MPSAITIQSVSRNLSATIDKGNVLTKDFLGSKTSSFSSSPNNNNNDNPLAVLDSTSSIMSFDSIKDDDASMELLVQKIALMEFQAKEVVKKHQNGSSNGKDLFDEIPTLRSHLRDLELFKTLGTKLDNNKKEIKSLNDQVLKADKTKFQLQEAKRIVQFLEQKVQQMEKDKTVLQGEKMVVQDKLTEAKRVYNYMQQRTVQVLKEKEEMEKSLGIKSDKLTFQLTEVRRISKFLETKLIEIKKEKEDNEKQHVIKTSDLEFKLQGVKRVNEYMQTKLNESNEQARKYENKIASLEFNLTESKRVCKFIQDKLIQTQTEKKQVEEQVNDLEIELSSMNLRLALKNDLIEQQDIKYKQQVLATNNANEQKTIIEGQLSVAQRMTGFLQAELARSEAEKMNVNGNSTHQKLQAEILSLKEQLDTSYEKCEMTQTSLNLALDEQQVTEARVRELELQTELLQARLLERTGTSNQENKLNEMTAQIASLTQQLTNAQRVAKDAEQRANKTNKNATTTTPNDALVDLELRLTQSEVANKNIKNELTKLQKEKDAADAKIRMLEQKLIASGKY